MKKALLYVFMLSSLSMTAQQYKICGFDEELALPDRQNPDMRAAFEKIIKNLKAEKINNPSSASAKLVNGYMKFLLLCMLFIQLVLQ